MAGDLSNDITSSERFRAAYFNKVIEGYASCRELPPVVAIQYDDTQPVNPKLTPQIIEYLVDVEHATHAALDHLGLFPTWEQMLNCETVPINKRAQVTDRCARVYIRRKLQPFDYFRPAKVRMHRPEHKRTAA